MRRNFEIRDNVTIVLNGASHDLHNDYDFSEFVFDIEADVFTLSWQDRHNGRSLRLIFKEVSLLRMKESDPGFSKSERRTINVIGFAWPDEVDSMNTFIPNLADETYHLLIEFMDGSAIKVFSESADVLI